MLLVLAALSVANATENGKLPPAWAPLPPPEDAEWAVPLHDPRAHADARTNLPLFGKRRVVRDVVCGALIGVAGIAGVTAVVMVPVAVNDLIHP